jgi:hypothetical protein
MMPLVVEQIPNEMSSVGRKGKRANLYRARFSWPVGVGKSFMDSIVVVCIHIVSHVHFVCVCESKAGPFYNGALSIYFLLVIRRGMKDGEIAKKYELWWHLVAIIWPLGTAIAATWLDLYAFIYLGCWIGQTPLGCQSDNEVECIRGENAFLYGWFFMGVPLFIINGIIMYCMVQIYRYIHSVAHTQERYDFESRNLGEGTPSPNRSQLTIQNPSALANTSVTLSQRRSLDLASTKREIAIQSFLYVGAFLITHVWSIVLFWGITLFGMTPPPYGLLFMQNIAWPLQGFFNVQIFLRPRINSLRRRHSELSYARLVYYATFRYDEWTARGTMAANTRRPSNRALVLQTTNQSQAARENVPSRHNISTAQLSNSSHDSDEMDDQLHSSGPTTTADISEAEG